MLKSDDHHLNGLILAGGKSSRMGFDKSQLNFHGEAQVVWLNTLLQIFCDRVFISGSSANIPGSFNFIEDFYPSGGPMNGILSAFREFPKTSWLVVPVDMPGIGEEAISYLISHRDRTKPATCFSDHDALEPLPLILEPLAYPLLLSRFEKGDESLHGFLMEEDAQVVPVSHSTWLQNVNFPWQV